MGVVSALLVIIGGGPTLAGLIGGYLTGDDEAALYRATTFDVLNNFIPVWAALLALGTGLALAYWRRTSRIYLTIATVLLAAALLPIGIELARAPATVEYGRTANPARGIRMIQFNALSDNSDLGAALDLVLDRDVDLITVEEPKRFRALEPYLQERYPFRTPCPRGRCRAIIYSRLPPLESTYDTLRGTWYLDKNAPGNGLVGVASMRLRVPDGASFTLVATHLRWPYPPIPVVHQRDVLLRYLRRLDPTTTVLSGDLNLAPWTYQMRALDREMAPMQRMTRALFSFPAPFASRDLPVPFPILAIDHIYAGSHWRLVRIERGPFAGSDHYPIIAEMVLANGVDVTP